MFAILVQYVDMLIWANYHWTQSIVEADGDVISFQAYGHKSKCDMNENQYNRCCDISQKKNCIGAAPTDPGGKAWGGSTKSEVPTMMPTVCWN